MTSTICTMPPLALAEFLQRLANPAPLTLWQRLLGSKTSPVLPESPFEYNPTHPIGTCALCGGEMLYNVPRMGPGGGFVHKETASLYCPEEK